MMTRDEAIQAAMRVMTAAQAAYYLELAAGAVTIRSAEEHVAHAEAAGERMVALVRDGLRTIRQDMVMQPITLKLPDGVRIVPVEEVAERTGMSVEYLTRITDDINAMLNDEDLKRRVDAAFYSGKIASEAGFDWFLDPDSKVKKP